MRTIFRVDASNTIGSGHVMRCLTLADALRSQDVECIFIHRKHPGELSMLIRERGYSVFELPKPPGPSVLVHDGDYAAWLGVTQKEDAEQTILALGSVRTDWLVVDHYSLDSEWERVVGAYVGNIFAIDDLANRSHECDLFLNQNYGTNEIRYHHLMPKQSKKLLGPQYALLRPEYHQVRKQLNSRDGQVERVLIFFGGSDSENITTIVLRVLCRSDFARIKVDVVVGKHSPHRNELQAIAVQRPHTCIYNDLPHLADLMADADLALGGGGSTTWERCCVGLPSIVIALAENQKPSCEALNTAGYIRLLGAVNEVSEEKIAAAFQYALVHPDELREQSSRMQALVPGNGAGRVCAHMLKKRHQNRVV